MDSKDYSRAELEEVVLAAVHEALEDAEPERVEQLAGRVLREFDERRRQRGRLHG